MQADATAAWQRLRLHAERMAGFDLRAAFEADPRRYERHRIEAPHLLADLSKAWIDDAVVADLIALAYETGLAGQTAAMWRGDIVNASEARPAPHWLLRADGSEPPCRDGSLAPQWRVIAAQREAMAALARRVRADDGIDDVLHIGIGGSGLGPQLALQALAPFCDRSRRIHFAGNLDGHDLAEQLRGLVPARTFVIVASKSFGTAETLANLRSVSQWFDAAGVSRDRHFVAVTARPEAARAQGISEALALPDWVGGRYSVWSAVGLPLAIALDTAGFDALLAGARAMDAHFRDQPADANLPLRLGLLDVWYRSFLHWPTRCVAPYHHGLRSLPAYWQQLEMESNGKGVDASGAPLARPASAIVWGAAGTPAQHAFFQLLHQGIEAIPVEFIAAREAGHALPGHQDALLANALAQARALMLGQADPLGHRHCPGNRPSSFLLLQRLDPASLGALLALCEHRVFTAAMVWGLNPFDQWGVELGKTLARDIETRMASGDIAGLDGSTAGLLRHLRS